MSEKQSNGSLVVLGAGPAGYPAAFYAADHGMDVTLIDDNINPGGVCLYKGCIPSKALLHLAKLINETEESAEMGVTFAKPRIDVDQVRKWKQSVVDRLTGGVGQLAKLRKVRFIQGRGTFLDNKTIEITKTDGGKEKVAFEKAIIATGSRPTKIPKVSIDSPRVLDSTSALEIQSIPETLLVIGGGYIGLEMGTVYAALGSKVDVIEMLDGLLPGADRDLVTPLAKRLEKKFGSIMLSSKVLSVKEDGKGLRVTIQTKDGKEEEKVYDKILVSVGRRPNSENLGLEKTKVKVTDKGFIEIDAQRRTAEPNIFAVGDIAGEPMLAHKGTHEAIAAVEAIMGKKTIFEPRAIPAVVFTDPEIAWCGLTETEAKRDKLDVKVSRFAWAASGRAITLERTEGVTKIITDSRTERVLGVGICGAGAGELIAEGALAIEMGATAADLKLTIHPHPTLSETIMESAEAFYGNAIHAIKRKG